MSPPVGRKAAHETVRRGIAFAGLLAFGAIAACASGLTRAESQFAEGRYPDAARTLGSLEAESRTWSDAKRAEYALYRGLTRSALGDRDKAAVWLREARAIEDAHPGSLSRENAQRLQVGTDNLGAE